MGPMRSWATAVVLLGLIAVAAAMQTPVWHWLIEDSAISFAFSRNVVEGHGLVPFRGGERVEGFSNPLWVALLAVGVAAGFDPFVAARWLGVGLLLVTVPSVWGLARRLGAGLLAASVAATSATLAIWSASGLESPLYFALLASGAWRLVVEAEVDRPDDGGPPRVRLPLSALLLAGVALTRPEGVMFALAGGLWLTASRLLDRRPVAWLVGWWALLLVPLLACLYARWAYFALPLPATYYSKLGVLKVQPWDFDQRGWRQLRSWSLETGAVFLLPLIALGVTGWRGWRAAVGLGATALVWLVLLIPGPSWLEGIGVWPIPAPPGFDVLRMVVLVGFLVVVPLAGAGLRGWRILWLCWGLAVCAVAFSIRSHGDWMAGFRFLSPAMVFFSVLLGVGLARMGDALRPSRTDVVWGLRSRLAVTLALLAWAAPNLAMMADYRPDTTPWGVKRRLDWYVRTFDRLDLDRPFFAVDHDMGGMMWWHEPGMGQIVDTVGLVDLPFALHHKQREFVTDYLLERRTFDLAHAHATTGAVLRRQPRFRQEYVEIQGYPSGSGVHQGNFIRRDLFLRADRLPSGPTASFGRMVTLRGLEAISPEVGPGAGLFIEIGLSARRDFRLIAFAAQQGGDGLFSWDLPPGYGWVEPKDWRKEEAFVGRFSLRIPEDAPLGDYDVGLVVLDARGQVVAADDPASDPRFAAGEVRFPGLLSVVDRKTMLKHASSRRSAALKAAEKGRCADGEVQWERALRHRTRSPDWREKNRPEVATALARCWAEQARREPSLRSVDPLDKARRWDETAPEVREAGVEIADALWPLGLERRDAGDHEEAFFLLEAVVRADPTRAWARRWAEEARAVRLGLTIGGFGIDVPDEAPEGE